MKIWKQYTFGPCPNLLPIAETDWDTAAVKAAGFDPEDEEVSVCELTDEWNDHPRGSRVVLGMTATGHPFAIEMDCSECAWQAPSCKVCSHDDPAKQIAEKAVDA